MDSTTNIYFNLPHQARRQLFLLQDQSRWNLSQQMETVLASRSTHGIAVNYTENIVRQQYFWLLTARRFCGVVARFCKAK